MKKSSKIFVMFLLSTVIVALFFASGCKKSADIPVVTTESPSIALIFINCSGNVTDDGGAGVIRRGFCFSKTNTAPTIADDTVISGKGKGVFTDTYTGAAFTTYYVRAYATNKEGTGYGSGFAIKTSGIILP
jgi:hypothetical protein